MYLAQVKYFVSDSGASSARYVISWLDRGQVRAWMKPISCSGVHVLAASSVTSHCGRLPHQQHGDVSIVRLNHSISVLLLTFCKDSKLFRGWAGVRRSYQTQQVGLHRMLCTSYTIHQKPSCSGFSQSSQDSFVSAIIDIVMHCRSIFIDVDRAL